MHKAVWFSIIGYLFLWGGCTPPPFFTEIDGRITNVQVCGDDSTGYVRLWVWDRNYGDFFEVDSFPVSPDGHFYRGFHGADMLEVYGYGQCPSIYHSIKRGYYEKLTLTKVMLSEPISFHVPGSAFSAEATDTELRLIRRLPTGRGNFRPIQKDDHTYFLSLGTPKDTIITLSLPLDQFYVMQLWERKSNNWLFIRDSEIRIDEKTTRISL